MMTYTRFALMILTSTVVMFGLMYLNTYVLEHVFWSETRVYMAILMGAVMAVIMMGFMFSMYPKKGINIGIFAASAAVFALSLWLVRSQATVDGVSYMRAMIPHHSIAIMTSKRAQITDPRVRKLADEIIAAQEREIAEMRYLIADLSDGEQSSPDEIFQGDQDPQVMPLAEALQSPQLATLDPEPIQAAEAAKVLTTGVACTFRRTEASDPILVARGNEGVMKVNGELVPLQAEGAGITPDGGVMTTEGGRMTVTAAAGTGGALGSWRGNADLVFHLDQGLTVGYRGFYECEG